MQTFELEFQHLLQTIKILNLDAVTIENISQYIKDFGVAYNSVKECSEKRIEFTTKYIAEDKQDIGHDYFARYMNNVQHKCYKNLVILNDLLDKVNKKKLEEKSVAVKQVQKAQNELHSIDSTRSKIANYKLEIEQNLQQDKKLTEEFETEFRLALNKRGFFSTMADLFDSDIQHFIDEVKDPVIANSLIEAKRSFNKKIETLSQKKQSLDTCYDQLVELHLKLHKKAFEIISQTHKILILNHLREFSSGSYVLNSETENEMYQQLFYVIDAYTEISDISKQSGYFFQRICHHLLGEMQSYLIGHDQMLLQFEKNAVDTMVCQLAEQFLILQTQIQNLSYSTKSEKFKSFMSLIVDSFVQGPLPCHMAAFIACRLLRGLIKLLQKSSDKPIKLRRKQIQLQLYLDNICKVNNSTKLITEYTARRLELYQKLNIFVIDRQLDEFVASADELIKVYVHTRTLTDTLDFYDWSFE